MKPRAASLTRLLLVNVSFYLEFLTFFKAYFFKTTFFLYFLKRSFVDSFYIFKILKDLNQYVVRKNKIKHDIIHQLLTPKKYFIPISKSEIIFRLIIYFSRIKMISKTIYYYLTKK